MLSRRELVQDLALVFALPLYPNLTKASAEHVPLFVGRDNSDALAEGLKQIHHLGEQYMLPGTDSGPVQVHALALWRDANKMRTSSRHTKLMTQALQLEALAATMVGHIFAERGQELDARSWIQRATDAASVMWPDPGPGQRRNQMGVDISARASLLLWLDQGKHLTHPADTVLLTDRYISAGTTGSARAMALSVRARAESMMGPNRSESARVTLLDAGKWAQVEAGPQDPLSLFTYTPRQHDYASAGVYATLGYRDLSRQHRHAYLDPALPPAGIMNSILLDVGEADNVLHEHGPAAAATSVRQTLERIPSARRSAPVRDRAVAMTHKLYNLSQSGGLPREVQELGNFVTTMKAAGYLANPV